MQFTLLERVSGAETMLKPHYSASQLLWWLVIAGRSPIIVGLAVPIVEFAVGSVQVN